MEISPNNPHYRMLKKSLKNEGFGLEVYPNISERAAILGITEDEYLTYIQEFPFRTDKEADQVLQSIIAWYQMKQKVKQIMTTSSKSGRTSTRGVTTQHRRSDPQN